MYSLPYSTIEIIITTDGSSCKLTGNYLFLECKIYVIYVITY